MGCGQMKYLFIQLSDLHCTSSADEYTQKIDQAANAINSIGKFDSIILIFSGDLTRAADPNEFKAAKHVIGRFVGKIAPFVNNARIPIMIVPGNHDMVLPKGARTAAIIETWNKDEHLYGELDRLDRFFDYAASKDCFRENKLFDIKMLDLGGFKVQFCLLNSAPYSTRNPDDKQFHYFPPYVADKLVRDPEADIKITVMHHHFEWCEWNTKEMLQKAISSDDITFFGHDHKADYLSTKYANGESHNIIMGGEIILAQQEKASFNAVVYDSDTELFEHFIFTWSIENGRFHPQSSGHFSKRQNGLVPRNEFIEKISKDNQGISEHFTDYFVLPKLYATGDAFSDGTLSDTVDVDKIFEVLQKDKAIQIVGDADAGKTTLIKYLFLESIKRGFIPLLIEKRDYRDSRIEKMIKDLFEEQYGLNSEEDYDAYVQADNSKKIVFIDDVNLIDNPKARQNLINSILDSGKMLIFSATDKNLDLEEAVKNKLQGKTISSLEIQLFYKESRDQLVDRVALVYHRSTEDIHLIKAALDYMVQSQTGFFNFTPASMLQYIRYYLNAGAENHKGVQTISMVFEMNIRNALVSNVNEHIATIYLAALEYIADQMYFLMCVEEIPLSMLETMIQDYNSKKKTSILPKDFLRTCINSHILKENDASFAIRFYDNNTYAYFVAKSINREFERNPEDRVKFTFVMNNICFGINDSIILFLSFIRNNAAIITKIAEKAIELLKDFPEWDFAKGNIPFLQQTDVLVQSTPSAGEARETHQRIEQIEKERHKAVKFRSVFDYNPSDASKPQYVIGKAIKYTNLVGRALVDQYGSLEAEEIAPLLDALFSVPQKVVYAALKPYQDHIDEIITTLTEFAKEQVSGEVVTEQKIRKMFGQAGTNLALNILNEAAYNASNCSTISVLRERNDGNANQKILQLMMEENSGVSSAFVDRAVALRKELDGIPYARILIAQIARKHIIFNESISHRSIDMLVSGKVISPRAKPLLLKERGSKEKS